MKKVFIVYILLFFFTIVCGSEIVKVVLEKQVDIERLHRHTTVYLAIDEIYYLDNDDYRFYNENDVVELNNNTIVGKNVGKTIIYNGSKRYDIEVSDKYLAPHIDNDKDEIPCGMYTKEDNEYLDLVLKTKIEDKGFKTRAGCVEAARFLLLQFPYKLHYFSENGRLPYVDGEGRYLHYGLYLNMYKADVENLYEKKKTGPAPWGCFIYNVVTQMNQRNSLDCSGFVTWALYNGGCDPGDLGAGPRSDVFDCSDLGEKNKITEESLDRLKVGDLFAGNGHIAICVGKKDGLIYIAESDAMINVRCLGWSKQELINSEFYAWIDMDEFYNYQDGNLTDYWE